MRAIVMLLLFVPFISKAQWQNGTDIYNTNSGNVGIGTTSPNAKLELKTSAIGTGVLRLSSSATGANPLHISLMGTGESTGGGGRSNVASTIFQRSSDGADMFQLDMTNRQAYFIGGNVGIGTTNPSNTLHLVNPSSSTYLNIENASAGEVDHPAPV